MLPDVTMQLPDAGRLLSIEVRSADGKRLGRIGSVYVPDGGVQPLLIAFPSDRDDPFVAPLFGAELTADALVLGYPAEQVTAGPTVDAEALLSAGEIVAVLAYYGRAVTTRSLTERMEGVRDVGFTHANVRAVPQIPDIGDEDLPPIVVTRPSHSG